MTSEIYVSVEELRNEVLIDATFTDVSVNLMGIQGPRGNSVLSGTGPPAGSIGIDGDFYIDVFGKAIYGPKTNSIWPDQPLSTFASTNRFIFAQASPSDQWVINHSLGGRPSVTVVDSAATTVIGDVSYISDTQIVVRFTAPFSGFAYLT
jgi:hypothetical protein